MVKVVSPIEGSPADRAGLKPGDLITKVDDTSMKGLSLNEAVKRMRGEPRTKVLLTIYRKDENRTFPVTIIREEIKTVSVKSKMIENGYGWIRVASGRPFKSITDAPILCRITLCGLTLHNNSNLDYCLARISK
jgi:carboxyl-terminal processing protease